MLTKATTYSFFLSAVLLFLWWLSFGHIGPSHMAAYQQEVALQQQLSMQAMARSTEQHRGKVVKEIFFTDNEGQRLHYRIESDASTLTLQPEGPHVDIIEHLQGMRCWMQDKLEEDAQQIRYFEATDGIYRYSAQRFLAQSVALSLYRLPGHDLPVQWEDKSPFLKGTADSVSFAVSGKTPQFQATQFTASLGGK